MTMTFEYNDKDVREALYELMSKMQNLEPVFKNIGETMIRQINLRFERGADPDGNPWAALAASTIERKGHGRPLIDRGDRGGLKGSINYRTTEDSVEIGTNMVYAAVCQFGSKPHVIKAKNKKALFWQGAGHPIRQVNHPGTAPRPFLGVNEGENSMTIGEEDKKKILGVIADFLALGPGQK